MRRIPSPSIRSSPVTCLVILLTLATTVLSAKNEDRWHWYRDARSTLERYLSEPINANVARNIIIFIGDGMGMSTVTAGRILRGQQRGGTGEEFKLTFETFPYVGLAKTYNIDSQVGDSAACATALLCGVKGNFETLGLDSKGRYEDCDSVEKSAVPSIVDWAQKEGKWTGFVTNTRITHGTPAGLYANTASRYWEDDSKLPQSAKGKCKDIAAQLVEDNPGRKIKVILGGGRRHLLPKNLADPRLKGYFGKRADGRNLMDEWLTKKRQMNARPALVTTKKEFDAVDPNATDYLLGVFSYSHMNFEVDRDDSDDGEPSLKEMTRKAIKILNRAPEGFVLMVEAGRMDHAHHFSNARRALDEVHSLDDCIQAALAEVSPSDTLFVVTADHSHTMTIGGYPKRGNPVLGKDSRLSDVDNMPYTTVLYGNGPGYSVQEATGRRENLTNVDTAANDYIQQSAVPRRWETHGGEDVPVYALGPMAHLLRGTYEQTYVPHAAAYAACIGESRGHCERAKQAEHRKLALCREFLNISNAQLRSLANRGGGGGAAGNSHAPIAKNRVSVLLLSSSVVLTALRYLLTNVLTPPGGVTR